MSTDEGGPGPSGIDVGELIDARMLEIEKEKEKLRLKEKAAQLMGQELEALKQKIELESKSLDQLRVYIQEAIKNGETQLGQESELKKMLVDQVDTMKKYGNISTSAYKKINKMLADSTTSLEDIETEMQKIKASLKDVGDFTQTVESGFSSISNKFGIMFDVGNTGIGKMMAGMGNLFNNLSQIQSKLKSIGTGFLQLTSPTTVVANIFQSMVGQFKDMEQGAISMVRAVGGTREAAMIALVDMESRYKRFGVTAANIGKNFEKATFSISGFKSMNQDSGRVMSAEIAMLEKFGASAEQQMKMINKLAISNGKNIQEAHKQVRTLVIAAREMGIDGSMALTDFDGALSKISSTGADATREFLALAHQAKVTGTAVQDLIGVAVKFDTFKDAASFVAMLNGTLGTNLSSIEIMQMDLNQRVAAIREGIIATVGDFGQLDRATKLMIANQIAGGDLQKAKMMLKMASAEEVEEQNRAQKAMEDQQAAMQKLVDTGPQLLDFMTELRNTFIDALGGTDAYKDTLKDLIKAAGNLVELAAKLASNIKLLTFSYIGARTALVAYQIYQKTAIMLNFRNNVLQNVDISLKKKKKAAEAAGIPITIAAGKATMGFGAATRFALGPLGQIIGLLALLMATFLMSGSPQLYLMAGVMAVGVIALGTAMYFAGPAIIPVVLALGLLMGAMALVFHALPPLIDSVRELFITLTENSSQLFKVAAGLAAIGGAFVFLGASALIATIGIAAGSIALVALRAAMFLSGTSFDDMQKTGESIFKVGTGIERFSKGLSSMAITAAKISESLGDTTLVATVSADKTSLVAGKDALFASLMGGSTNITVDVNMPEQEQQTQVVNVYLDGEMIDSRVYEIYNGAQ